MLLGVNVGMAEVSKKLLQQKIRSSWSLFGSCHQRCQVSVQKHAKARKRTETSTARRVFSTITDESGLDGSRYHLRLFKALPSQDPEIQSTCKAHATRADRKGSVLGGPGSVSMTLGGPMKEGSRLADYSLRAGSIMLNPSRAQSWWSATL